MNDKFVTRDDAQLKSLKTLTLVVYVLYALSYFTGITAIIGIIINYIKKKRSREPGWKAIFAGRYAPTRIAVLSTTRTTGQWKPWATRATRWSCLCAW